MDSVDAIGGSPPELGHCWNEWPAEDNGVTYRYWSVHKLAVASRLLIGEDKQKFEDMGYVCFCCIFSSYLYRIALS